MAESACEEPFDGAVINERARFINLVEELLNEIEEWQEEESVEDEGIQELDIAKEIIGTQEEFEDTWQESEGTNEDSIYQLYNDLPMCQEDLVPEASPEIFDSWIIDCKSDERSSFLMNENGSLDLSSCLEDSHDQSHVPSELPGERELNSTVEDLERRVNDMKERVSTFKARLDDIESEKQERISSFSQMLEAAYRETLGNLNQRIAIALQSYADADIRVREADEKVRLLYSNAHKQQYDYEAMKLQLQANLAAAEKFDLLKVHGKLHLERREALLNKQIDAEERDFDEACAKKQADMDTLDSQYEAAQAKKRLFTGDITESEKGELLEKLKGDNEFMEMHQKHMEIERKNSEMKEILKKQMKQIENLKMETLQVDEDLRKAKKVGKWKRRVLAFFCIRIDDNDDIN